MITRAAVTTPRILATRSLNYRSWRRDRMSPVSLLSILDALPVDPHPELVAIQSPTPREVAQWAALLGWLPDEDRFRPVPIGERGM